MVITIRCNVPYGKGQIADTVTEMIAIAAANECARVNVKIRVAMMF